MRTALALAHLARLALAAALAAVLAAALAADCGLADLDLDVDLVEAPEVGEARRGAGFVSERREACRSRNRKQVLTWSVVSSQVLRVSLRNYRMTTRTVPAGDRRSRRP